MIPLWQAIVLFGSPFLLGFGLGFFVGRHEGRLEHEWRPTVMLHHDRPERTVPAPIVDIRAARLARPDGDRIA